MKILLVPRHVVFVAILREIFSDWLLLSLREWVWFFFSTSFLAVLLNSLVFYAYVHIYKQWWFLVLPSIYITVLHPMFLAVTSRLLTGSDGSDTPVLFLTLKKCILNFPLISMVFAIEFWCVASFLFVCFSIKEVCFYSWLDFFGLVFIQTNNSTYFFPEIFFFFKASPVTNGWEFSY